MAHIRKRFLTSRLMEQGKFWPIVGLLGARQSGKTTLLRDQLNIPHFVSLDDEATRDGAESSAKVFLSRLETPVIIDEIQKVPKLFDALKAMVDKRKVPGRYFITGSTQFSSKLGIRESLTGRIGISYLQPLTLREMHEKAPPNISPLLLDKQKPLVDLEKFIKQMALGGMPLPAFLRDRKKFTEYWGSWLDTAIYRDLPRLVGPRFDPAFAFSILRRMGKVLTQGELPTLKHFNQTAARLRIYFQAFEDLFLVKKIHCHDYGIGKEIWIFFDAGIASYFMDETTSTEATLSLARQLLWSETSTRLSFDGMRDERVYFKSQKGTPIDWVWNDIPMKIVASTKQLGWEERALSGAMKKLGAKMGCFLAPVDSPQLVAKGISILPWNHWS